MVWVEGSSRPKRPHETLELAQQEAARLATIIDATQHKRVHILATVDSIELEAPQPTIQYRKARKVQAPA